jgi:hypothetical protein
LEKLTEIQTVFVELIDFELQYGFLYVSEEYATAVHLCACGCGGKTVTPLGKGEWNLSNNNGVVTLRPSIGNFAGENPYHAHYYITNNKIDWLK